MSNKNSEGGGCFAIVGVVLVIGLALWAINFALWILGFIAPFAGIGLGIYFFVKAGKAGQQTTAHQFVEQEFDEVVRDASVDLADTITRWDILVATKGIGTELEGQESVIRDIQQRMWGSNEALQIAGTPRHKAEAVNQADSIRREAEQYL